jgi:hypothetical protein
MKCRMQYCPTLGRDVEVLEVSRNGSPESSGGDTLCLNVEGRCTGEVCPICTVAPQVILEELNRLTVLGR